MAINLKEFRDKNLAEIDAEITEVHAGIREQIINLERDRNALSARVEEINRMEKHVEKLRAIRNTISEQIPEDQIAEVASEVREI